MVAALSLVLPIVVCTTCVICCPLSIVGASVVGCPLSIVGASVVAVFTSCLSTREPRWPPY
ncbi:hypothetical protein PF005_g12723 [Phytophthora fragariae]|uniref:Secreted peptide n=1 Tax=Phytophthora fragariae TaxID=53985 RepID=A0A6A3ET51_9STRA|nr:hypothetical protein PF003_g6393 [Phytophthora fragariae]KAE8936634.1 hypothetical protein PF009_g13450 [Phytophthora fragariae]KAE9003981.1 hypothetical protein PF011_g12655 [Phytophthora fragariae]KAE9122929.1 hypothetical protein PF007_g7257 [Phytophthora fragariae]KAE9207178.1 hypothetical protein PF005_g12723 [Phytophthora fragariae]